jgi:chromosome segregation ATPase
MNEQQAAFLRQWYAAWQEHQKRVAALEERLAALERRLEEVWDWFKRLEKLTLNHGEDVEQLWADWARWRARYESEDNEDE